MVVNLLNALQKEKVTTEPDKISWTGGKGDLFSVREASKVLQPRSDSVFPVEGVWVSLALTKMAFFAWETAWGKVLTLDNLQRRGRQFPNRCFLCECDEETIHHILMHFPIARSLWDLFFSLVGVKWVFLQSVK